MIRKLSIFFLILLSAQTCLLAVEKTKRPTSGPWNQDLDLYESQDGIQFTRQGVFMERAGVPNLLFTRKKLYAVFQWFPSDKPGSFDRVAISTSLNQGKTWSKPQTVKIDGLPDFVQNPIDPALVETSTGAIRLYFASDSGARQEGGPHRPHRMIYSAISEDGVQFQFEEGVRFSFDEAETYDPTAIFFEGAWHLFCPAENGSGAAYHAVSTDGLQFETRENVSVPDQVTWIGNVVAAKKGLRFYGSGRGVWMAESTDGNTWQINPDVHLSGGDPAVVRLPNGTYLAIVTSEPRRNEDAPESAHQRKPPKRPIRES